MLKGKLKTILNFVLLMVFCTMISTDSGAAEKHSKPILRSPDDLHGKTIAVYEGTVHDRYLAENYPTSKIKRYDSVADMILSISTGKVDAAFMDLVLARLLIKKDARLTLMADDVLDMDLGVGFSKKNPELRMEFNAYLKEIRANGIYRQIEERWFENDPEEAVMPDIETHEDGPLLRAAVAVEDLPYVAFMDNEYVGFDIELIRRFARDRGYNLKFLQVNYSSLVAILASGKADLISDGIAVSPERQQQVDFSDPYAQLRTGVIVRKDRLPAKALLNSLEDLHGRRLGIFEGSVFDPYARKKYPTSSTHNFSTIQDMILALKTNKIDAFLMDDATANVAMHANPQLAILGTEDLDQNLAVGFHKGEDNLRKRFNKFMQRLKDDGTWDEMTKRWFEGPPDNSVMPELTENSSGPVLTFGTDVVDLPFVTYYHDELVGFDIEMVKRFAMAEGYQLKIFLSNFPSLIPAVVSGKADLIAAGMASTRERGKEIDFSDPYHSIKTVTVTTREKSGLTPAGNGGNQAVGNAGEATFISRVVQGFKRNILHEKRYLLILDGLKTTAVISIWSVLLGTLMGGVICYMRMQRSGWLKVPAQVFISVIRGTPILVILMITFYVILGSVDIDPVLVSIIAFGLNFAAYVSEMFRTGIEGVDKGQTEAGIAMGFSTIKTFISIVAPQAIRRILPVFKGEVISLVKMTSIVGYIAVQDLTKAGDIIRSRTFDAFFPLIMVAVLYFLISNVLLIVLNQLEIRVEPKRKTYRSQL